MEKEVSHHQTLGVKPGASPRLIKKAYRKLAFKLHPDRGGDANEFARVKFAYDALCGVVPQPTIDSAIDSFLAALRETRDPSAALINIAISNLRKRILKLLDTIVETGKDIELTEDVISRLTGEKSIPDALRADIQDARQEITQAKHEIDTNWDVIYYLMRFDYRSDYGEKNRSDVSNKTSTIKRTLPRG